MPPGRRRRRERGGRQHRRRSIARFLEPCLLLLLSIDAASHGYELADALAPFGLGEVDSSLIYRTLRQMEADSLVQSEWDADASAGPARRVYRLTEAGNAHLAAWVADLRELDKVLQHHFLATYDQHTTRQANETSSAVSIDQSLVQKGGELDAKL